MLFECGYCLRPNDDMISKMKARFKTLIAPCYLLLVKNSRWKKHGEQPWQEDHWEERPQKVPRSIIIPQSWINGRTMNIQAFQSAVGWNAAYCRYLDYFCTVDISYIAPHHQRSRNDNTITMKSGDPDLQAFPMAKREDFKKTTKDVVQSLKRTRENSFIPQEKSTRQRDELDPAFQER